MIDRHLPAEMFPRFPCFPVPWSTVGPPQKPCKVARVHRPALADIGARPTHADAALASYLWSSYL
jgi:hypothetical protein